jgi:PucR family transcriptional regulator, purine catabolism regulatory protein
MGALHPIDPSSVLGRKLRVADLFDFPGMSEARVVAGHAGLESRVAAINVMQVPTDRYAKADGLLLAAATVFSELADPAALLERLATRRVAALAVRGAPLAEALGPAAIEMSERCRLPLIELPSTAHLDALMTELLETLVADQYLDLRAAGEVRDRLTGYVLSGGGLEGLPDAIAEIVEGDVAAYNASGVRLAASGGADVESADGVARTWVSYEGREPLASVDDWVVWPVHAGAERLGALVARPGAGRAAVAFAALEHGATNAALQLLHEREARAADSQLREGFFRDLLQGSLEAQAAERRARAIGWVPDTYRVVLVEGSSLRPGDIAGLVDESLVVQHGNASLAVLSEQRDGLDLLTRALKLGHVGVSAPHEGLTALPDAVAEAREALDAARLFDGRTVVRRFEQLGPLRMLARVPPDELAAFHRHVLAPLDGLPDEVRETLIPTLELLLATGMNVAETARRGGWHYNTVRYRVARISELLGPLIDEGPCLEAVSLALLVRRELGKEVAHG